MEPTDGQILELYDWQTGDCFRCAKTNTDTTLIAIICPHSDGQHEVRACRPCVLDLEAMRRQAAESHGQPYEPGKLAHRVE